MTPKIDFACPKDHFMGLFGSHFLKLLPGIWCSYLLNLELSVKLVLIDLRIIAKNIKNTKYMVQ